MNLTHYANKIHIFLMLVRDFMMIVVVVWVVFFLYDIFFSYSFKKYQEEIEKIEKIIEENEKVEKNVEKIKVQIEKMKNERDKEYNFSNIDNDSLFWLLTVERETLRRMYKSATSGKISE